MGRLSPRTTVALVALALLGSGCTLSFVKTIEGDPTAARRARTLAPGATLAQVLSDLGAPDVLVALGADARSTEPARTRLYYVHHVLSETRFTLFGIIPVGGTTLNPTVFIHRFGGETLELARLDFDARGILVEPQYALIPISRADYSVAVDNRLAETFYEDRDRSLFVRDRARRARGDDEDDEDDSDDEPRR